MHYLIIFAQNSSSLIPMTINVHGRHFANLTCTKYLFCDLRVFGVTHQSVGQNLVSQRRSSVKPCPHCRRKVRLSPKRARQRRNSAIVALFCDSVDMLLRVSWPTTRYDVDRAGLSDQRILWHACKRVSLPVNLLVHSVLLAFGSHYIGYQLYNVLFTKPLRGTCFLLCCSTNLEPTDIRGSPSLDSFKRHIKTHDYFAPECIAITLTTYRLPHLEYSV